MGQRASLIRCLWKQRSREVVLAGVDFLKVVHISTFDIQGGAARAAYRLHTGLRRLGLDSSMLVRYRTVSDNSVVSVVDPSTANLPREAFLLEQVIQQQYMNTHRSDFGNTVFSLPYPGYDLSAISYVQTADVIHLHWVAYYQSPVTIHKLLATGKPVVWTLHDQWPFTGGCHYTAGCLKYRQNCEACPQLTEDLDELPAAILRDKEFFLRDGNLTVVAPSQWMAACAAESRFFEGRRIEVIPYSLDSNAFHPLPKSEAKNKLGLQGNTVTLLFGAHDGGEKRKGFHVLRAAMQQCLNNPGFQQLLATDRLRILCFGRSSDALATMAIPTLALGQVDSDEELCTAYSAADLFLLPSLEDNLPNTLLEAMSCGTPVIASDVGGIAELVTHGVTGYLTPAGDAQQLGEGILAAISDPDRLAAMGQEGRHRIEQGYGLEIQAGRYLDLYRDLGQAALSGSVAPVDASEPAQTVNQDTERPASPDPAIGPHFKRIYPSVLLKALQEFAPMAYENWRASEIDRAARLVVINQLSEQLMASTEERAAQREVISILKERLATNEAQQAHQIRELQSTVIWLSTTKGALRKLLGNVSRRIGIYPFLLRHRNTLRNIYRFPLLLLTKIGKASQMRPSLAGSQSPDVLSFAPNPQPSDLINSPLVEALVSARSLKGDATEGALVEFYELGTRLHKVLCIRPSARNIQALYMLAKAGAEVACVSGPGSEDKLGQLGFSTIHLSPTEWLQAHGAAALAGYDGLLLDASTDLDLFSLLKDSVGPDTKMVIHGNLTEEAFSKLARASAPSKDGELTVVY